MRYVFFITTCIVIVGAAIGVAIYQKSYQTPQVRERVVGFNQPTNNALSWISYDGADQKEKTIDIKVLTTPRLTTDLQSRYVLIPPGQMWGFSSEQKVTLEILQTKQIDDSVVIVAVKLSATANLPAAKEAPKVQSATKPGDKTAPATETAQSVNVQLNGVAKMHYELIAGEWYLLDVTSVNLQVTQK